MCISVSVALGLNSMSVGNEVVVGVRLPGGSLMKRGTILEGQRVVIIGL